VRSEKGSVKGQSTISGTIEVQAGAAILRFEDAAQGFSISFFRSHDALSTDMIQTSVAVALQQTLGVAQERLGPSRSRRFPGG